MTVSSIDLSNSSKTTDSISSVSSVQSSLSSTSSDDVEDAQGYDQQWNILWKNHYEEEYMKNYREFILNTNSQDDNPQLDDKVLEKKNIIINKAKNYHRNKSNSDDNEFNSDVEIKKIHRKIVNSKLKNKHSINAVSSLLDSLKMEEESNQLIKKEINSKIDMVAGKNEMDSSSSIDENIDAEQMSSMGLPVAFTSKKKPKDGLNNTRKRS